MKLSRIRESFWSFNSFLYSQDMKNKDMTFWDKAKRFFEPLLHYKLLLILSIIKFSLWAIYTLVSVYIIRYALLATEAHNSNNLTILLQVFVAFILVYLSISYIFRRVDWPYLYHDLERYIYTKYIPKIISLDNNYIESLGTGKLVGVVGTWKKQWVESLTWLINQLTKLSITWWVMIGILLYTNWLFWLAIILLLVLAQMMIIMFDANAHKYRKIRTNENAERMRKTVRIIMSRNEILQNNGLKNSINSILESIQKISDANGYINRALFAIFSLVRILSFWIRFFVLWYVWNAVISGNIGQADFVSLLAMIIVFENFLFESTEFYKNFTKDFSDIEKLWEVLDDGPQMEWYSTWLLFTPQKQDIIIDSISYGYNESKVFDNFSLTVKRGQKTALVWASGGGKTTLMKLIAGYLHPESGSISVLGNKLGETALKTYYPHIGYLTQDPGVFDATIRENLLSALTDIWDKKIIEKKLERALKLAHCDFVFDLEYGLDTEIWERWVRLSGGQKQRLAIAKIFLKDPEFILLDEPTSALDSFSEEAITIALDELFRDRTVIIVAHRLQTVRKADDIIVLEWGMVVERGSHSELVDTWGIYNRMLELQSGF